MQIIVNDWSVRLAVPRGQVMVCQLLQQCLRHQFVAVEYAYSEEILKLSTQRHNKAKGSTTERLRAALNIYLFSPINCHQNMCKIMFKILIEEINLTSMTLCRHTFFAYVIANILLRFLFFQRLLRVKQKKCSSKF